MTGDNISDALVALLRSRRKWDEAPGLYLIYGEGGSIRFSRKSVVPESGWDERPPLTLARFACAMEHAPPGLIASVAPEGFMGVVFRFEAWAVKQPDDPIGAMHAHDMQRARMLHVHPARVEQRCAWAVTREGTHYRASQVRGSRDVEASAVTEGAGGLVPESLARIIRAMSSGVN